MVVGYQMDELWKVVAIAIPLTNLHRKQVDILVELVEEGNSLDDHVVYLVDIEL